jgi:hypothetical protein
MITLSNKLLELLRTQVPSPGTSVAANPLVTLLQDVATKVNDLDLQVPRVLSVVIAGNAVRNVLDDAADVQLSATVTVQAGASQAVTWASSVPSVATVTSGGLVDILAAGTTVVTATSVFDTTKSASVTFVVTAA